MTSGAAVFNRPAALPADLAICFDNSVPAPAPGAKGRAEVIRLIAELKLSEAEKIACGKRIIAFYGAF